MTKLALGIYHDRELLLVCPSSTSDELSNVVGMNSFFRITTQDKIATQRVVSYLLDISNSQSTKQRITIIYNKNSSYCQSFRNAILQGLEQHPEKFYLLPECGELYDDYLQCLKHLESIQDQVNTIIIIPDGGIEPNSLNTAGIISRLRMNQCLIVGSATFYHDNVLQWTEENISRGLLDINNAGNLAAYVPWDWRSQCNSDNDVATNYCRLGAALWGKGRLTWRSATAYDSVLMVVKALQSYAPQDHRDLRRRINQHFRHDGGFESGVTGRIKFDRNGDRLEPPTEMVAVKWNSQTKRCEWLPA
jgi:ABC-type branched-subunit amino acid transport system substrate-binding protein